MEVGRERRWGREARGRVGQRNRLSEEKEEKEVKELYNNTPHTTLDLV